MRTKLLLVGIAATVLANLACGGETTTPVSPSGTATLAVGATEAAADGSTLKATAPAPQLPANGSTVPSLTPNLVIANSTLKYLGDVAMVLTLEYRFVVETEDGTSVSNVRTGTGVALTGSRVAAGLLQPLTVYRWRVRAELGSAFGPWSAYSTFATPKS
jgi:hypothetical protein